MKNATRDWVRKAEADYRGALRLASAREPFHDLVAFHCQQSAEKYLKALLEELGQLHEPALTKDAIAGRIRRLLAMADKKAQDLGIPDTEAVLTPEMLAEQQ